VDENSEIEEHLKKVVDLFQKLINHWHFWELHEGFYLETLTPQLVANPALGDKTEASLLREIAGELAPEDWFNLAERIREFRAGGYRQEKCVRDINARRQEKHSQADLWREIERHERDLQEREEAIRLDRELQKKEHKLEEERQRERERQAHFERLRGEFQYSFPHAYEFYKSHCSEYITIDEFEAEKTEYVRSWVAKNLDFEPDAEQAAAIGAIDGHVQVVARAGSGKTAVLVNRALFLQQHCGVSPDKMLLLAFNRKAAEEMRDRLSSKLQGAIPHTMTFHALAYALVHPEESILFDEPDGSKSKSRTLQSVIDEYIHDPNHYKTVRALMMAHFREDWERIALGGYDKTPEEMLRYRRSLPKEALDGKYLKSFGEKVIADFLFEHGIKYRYERNFWWDGTNYRPDFTIFTGNNCGIVIEYFGLQGDPDYDNMSEGKRKYWSRKTNWRFLEYSIKDLRDKGRETFLSRLKQDLENAGVECKRLSEEEIWYRIKDRAIDRFTNLVVNFVQRCRKQSLSPQELARKIVHHKCTSDVEQHFLNLAQEFYKSYLEQLRETGEDDFDGLIQKAAAVVASGQTIFRRKSGTGDLRHLRYVFIDEYQDFSDLFHRLLMAFRKRNSDARFFCVGDDWQAINGFAGSDLKFYENFGQFFVPYRKLNLTTNYRSDISIVDIGNSLMHGRGVQAHASRNLQGAVMLADLDNFQPTPKEQEVYPGDNFTPAVLRIVSKAVSDGQNVVLLSRKNTLPWYINYGEKESRNGELDRFLGIIRASLRQGDRKKVSISTVHKYKGLEQKIVVVLDAVVRSYPLLHPDLVFTRILGDSLDRAVDEERRLFYVALTRAAESLFIVTANNDLSPFLEGLSNDVQGLEWSDYPPLSGPVKHITVRVGNLSGKGGRTTYAIKDLLKADGYQWSTSGWHAWVRTYPTDGFSIDKLLSDALWAGQGDGLDVRFYDDLDKMLAVYRVVAGKWSSVS
jgi:DNA helicase-4